MHVFIDTNIFEQDPFWKNALAKTLLEWAGKGKMTLYLSEIVHKELRIHTLRNYKKTSRALHSNIDLNNKFRKVDIERKWDIDVQSEFDTFYQELEKDYNLKFLGYNKISFEKVMNRVLKREKPFNNDKTEVKDCGIWLTYAEYAESKKLSGCYLLTNNIKDFYKKEPVTQNPTEYNVHEELERDSKKFRGFPSIKDFIQAIIEPQIKVSRQFKAWLDATDIDNVFVFSLLRNKVGTEIESKIDRFVSRLDIMTVYNEQEWHFVGEVQVTALEWWDCQEIEIVVLEDSAVVSAVLNFNLTIEGHAYNPSHDDEESKYYSLGEKEIEMDVLVSFTLKEGGKLDSFDITDIELR